MNEETKPIESFEDANWKIFIEDCKARVNKDNTEKLYDNGTKNFIEKFKYEAEFLHNPEICHRPKYLLLGMEPSKPQEEEGAGEVSFFPLFLHYCAWKYLCGKEFHYYITDFAKGAMPVKNAKDKKEHIRIADESRNIRFPEWLQLVEREWKLLGKPEIILIGKYVYDWRDKINNKLKIKKSLSNCDIRKGNFIYHYTTNRTAQLKKEYDYIKEKMSINLDKYKFEEKELRDFLDILKKHLNGKCAVKPEYYEKLIEDLLKKAHWKDKVFPLYCYDFEQLKSRELIPHI